MEENKKIRVLVVFGAIANGGVEHIITDIFNNIDKTVFESKAVYHAGDCTLEDVPLLKETWNEMEQIPQFNTINWYSYRKWWKNYIKEHKHFDIIHLNYLDSAFCFIDLFNDVKTISIGHAHNPKSRPYSIGQLVSDIISYPARFMCKYLIACSKQTALEIFGNKATETKTSILLNGIDLTRFRYDTILRNSIRNNYNAGNKIIIGHVGRFAKQKNHEFIINVFELFHKKHSNSELWLIGEGDLKHNIKDLVKEKGINSAVRFIGIVNNVEAYMNAFDLFLFPSTYEGLGIVAVEAQATGLPCIVSDRVPDEADIKAGLFEKIPLESPLSEWQSRISNALHNIKREDQAANTKIAGFDIQDKASWVENFYKSIYFKQNNSTSDPSQKE